jgi:hypothetical protein
VNNGLMTAMQTDTTAEIEPDTNATSRPLSMLMNGTPDSGHSLGTAVNSIGM